MEEKEHIYLSTEHRKEIEGTVIFPSETSAFDSDNLIVHLSLTANNITAKLTDQFILIGTRFYIYTDLY